MFSYIGTGRKDGIVECGKCGNLTDMSGCSKCDSWAESKTPEKTIIFADTVEQLTMVGSCKHCHYSIDNLYCAYLTVYDEDNEPNGQIAIEPDFYCKAFIRKQS